MSSGNFLLSHKTIAEIIDSRAGIKEILNFPITISSEQPEPEKEGHIWIESEEIFTNIIISQYLTDSIPVGSLCLITGDKYCDLLLNQDKIDTKSGNVYDVKTIGYNNSNKI